MALRRILDDYRRQCIKFFTRSYSRERDEVDFKFRSSRRRRPWRGRRSGNLAADSRSLENFRCLGRFGGFRAFSYVSEHFRTVSDVFGRFRVFHTSPGLHVSNLKSLNGDVSWLKNFLRQLWIVLDRDE